MIVASGDTLSILFTSNFFTALLPAKSSISTIQFFSFCEYTFVNVLSSTLVHPSISFILSVAVNVTVTSSFVIAFPLLFEKVIVASGDTKSILFTSNVFDALFPAKSSISTVYVPFLVYSFVNVLSSTLVHPSISFILSFAINVTVIAFAGPSSGSYSISTVGFVLSKYTLCPFVGFVSSAILYP